MRGWIAIVAVAVACAGCGGTADTTPAQGASQVDLRDEWRGVFAEFLDGTYTPEISDEQVDAINDHYCADAELDYLSHIETVAMSHLPSGAFKHASPSTLATAAMVASASTSGCDGIADRDEVAAGMAERFR